MTTPKSIAQYLTARHSRYAFETHIGRYAGIGSRDTPKAYLDAMTEVAHELRQQGWFLRTGGAQGADQAFEKGGAPRCDIIRPTGWNIPRSAFKTAQENHPAWQRCSPIARKLLARNVCIIHGRDPLNPEPVEFVLSWRPREVDGSLTENGGTALTVRIAKGYGIPVYDIEDLMSYPDVWTDDPRSEP